MFPLHDNIPSRRVPVAMYAIIIANVVIFLFQLAMPSQRLEQIFYLFGIVPLRYTNAAWAESVGYTSGSYWPFLTGMFLHGGWLHIISNMWSLWIFGDNVEDRMGHVRFFLFYVLCGIASGFVHLLTNASSPLPTIGASGAIAGVLGAYLLLYPRARVLCLILLIFYPLFVELPAVIFIVVWFMSQFFSGAMALLSPGHAGGIAWWAHVGGFVAGAIIYRLFVGPAPPPSPEGQRVSRVYRNEQDWWRR